MFKDNPYSLAAAINTLLLAELRATDISNLKGCQKVAGGRSPRRPPEKVSHDRTQKGCQTSGQRKFTAKDLAPLRGATQFLAFPVVSADSDHRLLSLQPLGLLR